MNGISAVLITLNEAAVIERCIRSLAGLHQIVVHDTGSTDDTIKIARSMGADVSETRIEPFHFAKARNEALKHAKHKWVLSIDADDVLRDGSMGPMFDVIGDHTIAGYRVNHENRAVEGGSTMTTPRLALFKNGAWGWQYRVHERLFPLYPPAKVGYLTSCVIEHHPVEDKTQRRAQNLELLKMCVEENPQYLFASRQLGIEYVLQEKWEEAVPALLRYVEAAVDPNDAPFERAATRMHLAKSLARGGKLERALAEFDKASKEAPKRREPLYWAAIECLMAGRPWDALPWLRRCLEVPPWHYSSFSLYSKELQENLAQETLTDCEAMVEDAKKRLAAMKAGQP